MVRRGSGVRVPSSASTKDLQSGSGLGQRAPPATDEKEIGAGIGAKVSRASRSGRRSEQLVHPLAVFLAAPAWKGTVEATVDDTKHFNGGCRSLNADGTHWRCHIGVEAVRESIIGPDYLADHAPIAGRG
jgi:hypothetical protein